MQSWIINGTRKLTQNVVESSSVDLDKFAKIKISRAILSKSDISSFAGKNTKNGIIPSRCAIGLISESHNSFLKKGQRVFLTPYIEINSNLLICGKDIDGYLSDFAVAPNANVYPLPEGTSDESFAFIEDVALAIKACARLKIKPTQYVLIYGASDINLIFAQLCLYYQAIPIVIDTDDQCLSIAEEYGIYYTINSSKRSIIESLNEITSGKFVSQLVVDFDAFPEIDSDILAYVANFANVAFLGYDTSITKKPIDISYILSKHLSIYGCSDGIGEIESAINMIVTGIIKVDKLIESIYNFDDVKNAFVEISSKRFRFKNLVRC